MPTQPHRGVASARAGVWLAVVSLAASACAPLPSEHEFSVPGGPPSVELSGELFRPEGAGSFPAVLLLHGSGGLAPRSTRGRAFYTEMAEWLRSQGYVAFLIDSFSARQLPYRGAGVTAMRSYDRAFDVLGAIKHLETLPYVRSDKIAVLGWSHGGGAAIAARNRQGRHSELRVSASIAYYPPCRDFSWFSGTTPLLILMGDQDLLTPADDCRPLAADARKRGQPVELIVYPNATHAFDGESLPLSGVYLGPGLGKGEVLKYSPEAHRDAQERTRLFLERHLKH